MGVQYITDSKGKPIYAVVPIEEFERLTADDDAYWEDIPVEKDEFSDATIPGDVVNIMFDKDVSLLAAWRVYRGLSQKEAAEKAGISQSALSQMEKQGTRLQEKTRKLLANVYQCKPEHLVD